MLWAKGQEIGRHEPVLERPHLVAPHDDGIEILRDAVEVAGVSNQRCSRRRLREVLEESTLLLGVAATVEVERARRSLFDDELVCFFFVEVVVGPAQIDDDNLMAETGDLISQGNGLERRSVAVGVVHGEDADLHPAPTI
jgi:hypothetical protein